MHAEPPRFRPVRIGSATSPFRRSSNSIIGAEPALGRPQGIRSSQGFTRVPLVDLTSLAT
jgi:hypothetical protein